MNALHIPCPYCGSAIRSLLLSLAALAVSGCGGGEEVSLKQLGGPEETGRIQDVDSEGTPQTQQTQQTQQTGPPAKRRPGDGQSVQSLWDRAAQGTGDSSTTPDNPPSQAQFVKPERLKAAGLRTVVGEHLFMVTDLPSEPTVDGFPDAFDGAVADWVAYFALDPDAWRKWQMTCYLMKDKERFRVAGLLPTDLPAFDTSFALGNEFWICDQANDYSRARLMLDQGVRGLIFTAHGSEGPAWHTEGIAELLAIQRLQQERQSTSSSLGDELDARLLQRVRMIQDAVAAGRALRMPQIMSFDTRAQLLNEHRVWCWAACAFLDGHPRYQARFRNLCQRWSGPQFNQQFRQTFADDWRELEEEWLVFIAGIQHKHDFQRAAVDYGSGEPLPTQGRVVVIAADRGWQSSRVQLEAGVRYTVRARGRYQLATDPQQRVWWCEPGGVTIRYHDGRPLGILLGAVRPDAADGEPVTPLVRPVALGLGTTLRPEKSGTLYLRINDSYAELADNHGQLEVFIGPD